MASKIYRSFDGRDEKRKKNHPNYRSFDERQEGKKLFFNEFEG